MNIHYRTIREITLTGPMSEVKDALNWSYGNGYSTRISGPMPLASKYDITRYRIVAEKRIA